MRARVERALAPDALVAYGAAAALLLVAAVAMFPRDQLFDHGVPFPIGRLKVTDVLLGTSLLLWALGESRRDDHVLPRRAIVGLVGALLVLACAGVVTAHWMGTPLKLSLLELRPLFSLLLIFPLVAGARTPARLELGALAIVVAAAAASLVAIVRYVGGEAGAGLSDAGTHRVIAVELYPVVLYLWSLTIAALAGSRRLRLAALAAAVLGASTLLLTFERGAWLAAIGGTTLAIVLLPSALRRRVVVSLAALVAAGFLVAVAVNAFSPAGAENPLAAGAQRASTIANLDDDLAMRHRFAEWRRSSEEIRDHPLTGIGLGSSIRFQSPMYNSGTFRMGGQWETFYIHNSYIWVALKLGLPAAAIFVALLLVVAATAVAGYRASPPGRTSVVLFGAIVTLFASALMALVGPQLTSDNTVPYLAAVVALVEAARRLGQEQEAVVPDTARRFTDVPALR